MKFIDLFLTANSNLRRSKLRTFLTSSAVFIGALTLMLTIGVGYGLSAYVEEQVKAAGAEDALIIIAESRNSGPVSNDKAVVYNPDKNSASRGFGNFPTISEEELEEIRQNEEILKVTPLYSLAVEYLSSNERKVVGNISQSVEDLDVPLRAGRMVDVNGQEHEITIAPAFVKGLGFENAEDAIGNEVNIALKDTEGDIVELPVEIVGVQEKTLIQGNAMLVNTSFAEDAFNQTSEGLPDFQRYQYSAAVAQFDTSITDKQLNNLKKKLSDNGFSAQTLEDQLGVITSVIDGITTFLMLFAGIALAAASFGIVNTLLMAVQERTREIGLMKALGMRRRRIFILFSMEAILIGFWSSLIALGAANVIGRLGSNWASETVLKNFEGLELFSFPALPMLAVIGLIMLIAFLASTLPARRASRLSPIDALRYE